MVDAGNDAVLHVLWIGSLLLLNDTLTEDVGLVILFNFLAVLVANLAVFLQCKDCREVYVILQERYTCVLMQVSVGLNEVVKGIVQLIKQRLQTIVTLVLGLIGEYICKCALYRLVPAETFCLRSTLYLVGIDSKRHGFAVLGNTELVVLVKNE